MAELNTVNIGGTNYTLGGTIDKIAVGGVVYDLPSGGDTPTPEDDAGYWVTKENVAPVITDVTPSGITVTYHGQNSAGQHMWSFDGSFATLKISDPNVIKAGNITKYGNTFSYFMNNMYILRLPVITVSQVSSVNTSYIFTKLKYNGQFKASDVFKGETMYFNNNSYAFSETLFTDIDLSGIRFLPSASVFQYMFYMNPALVTIKFDTTPVTLNGNNQINMGHMFEGDSVLQSVDMSMFTIDSTSSVLLNHLFCNCEKLTSVTIPTVNAATTPDSSNYLNVGEMFYNCKNLETVNLTSLNRHLGTNAGEMFYNCERLTSVTGLNKIKPSSLQIYASYSPFYYMFYGCKSLPSMDLSVIDFSDAPSSYSARAMQHVFDGCTSLTSVTLPDPEDAGYYYDFSYAFNNCKKLQTISNIDFIKSSSSSGNPFNINNAFAYVAAEAQPIDIDLTHAAGRTFGEYGAYTSAFKGGKFGTIDLSGINVSHGSVISSNYGFFGNTVTNVSTFRMNGSSLTNGGTGAFALFGGLNGAIEMKNCTFTGNNFKQLCHQSTMSSITTADFSGSTWNERTSGGYISMYQAFNNNQNMTSIDLGTFNSSVTDAGYLFSGCSSLRSITMNGFVLTSGANTSSMFYDVPSDVTIYLYNSDAYTLGVLQGLLPNATIITE